MDVFLQFAVSFLAFPSGEHQEVGFVDSGQERVEVVGEIGAFKGLRDSEEDPFLRDYPFLRPSFRLIDELHGEVIAVIVKLERSLIIEQLSALPTQGIKVIQKAPLVLLQSPRELQLFGLDLFLKFLHKQLHFQLQLHAQVVQSVVELFRQQSALLKVELDDLGLSTSYSPLVQQLH